MKSPTSALRHLSSALCPPLSVLPNFTIIIPFQKETPYLRQTLDRLAGQAYQSFEVVLIPDGELDSGFSIDYPFPVIVEVSGPVSPAIKRDMGAKVASGQFLAFIDDDAYPAASWLENLLPHFADGTVAAVGGPQVTPPDDGFWQQVVRGHVSVAVERRGCGSLLARQSQPVCG